jgi:hypothetical protein
MRFLFFLAAITFLSSCANDESTVDYNNVRPEKETLEEVNYDQVYTDSINSIIKRYQDKIDTTFLIKRYGSFSSKTFYFSSDLTNIENETFLILNQYKVHDVIKDKKIYKLLCSIPKDEQRDSASFIIDLTESDINFFRSNLHSNRNPIVIKIHAVKNLIDPIRQNKHVKFEGKLIEKIKIIPDDWDDINYISRVFY